MQRERTACVQPMNGAPDLTSLLMAWFLLIKALCFTARRSE